MTGVRRVLVVGGGPAGTTATIALGRAGIETLVVEREDRARPVGVGLALQNSPLRALHQLGLLDAAFGANVRITPSDRLRIDRSLDGSRFRDATGFVAVMLVLGVMNSPWAVLALPAALLVSAAFAAGGVICQNVIHQATVPVGDANAGRHVRF